MANIKSLTLTGASSQSLSRANDATIQALVSTLTIECWFKCSNGAGITDIITRFGDNGPVVSFALQILGSNVSWRWKPSGGSLTTLNGNANVKNNSWHHIAVTYNSSGSGGGPEEIIYVDTVQDVINSSGGGAVNLDNVSQYLVVNGHLNSSGFIYNQQDMQIDDLRIWSTVRTQAQIAANYQRELAGNESGLVAYWKFNDAYTDSTSNGFTLGPNGVPSFTTDVPFDDSTTTSTSTTTTSTSTSTTTTSTSSSTTTTSTSSSTSTTSSTSTSRTTTSTTSTITTTSTTTTSTSTTTTSTSTTTTSTSTSTTTSTSTSTTMTIDLKLIVEKFK